jgi:phospholipid/cholesterol/gamma-HCH transport system substrate-binding protein
VTIALNRPNLIARAFTLIAGGICIAVVALLVLGGSSTYELNLLLPNASGLRPGSQVLLGGVPAGNVYALNLNKRNVVVADLHLNPSLVRVGTGATASIVAANLLGEKYVSIQPGDSRAPLPSGSSLPESATTLPTDLDQIVGVLDDPTRADLSVLLNEAGTAVAGRQADVGAILRQFPLSLTAATKLLTTLVQDNHTLGDLVANSNQFIARVNGQSGALKHVIDASAGAMTTLALRASALQQTIDGMPGVARSFTDTFVEGRSAILPLIPAAAQIVDAAPQLDSLLKAVKPFTAAAVPTLNRAAASAPLLERLATQGTPIVKLAVPTLASLDTIAQLAAPLSAWAGLSSSDLFNIFAGWTRAIQFRDGLSHVFNGDVYFSPGVVLNLANKGATAAQKRQNLLDIKSPDILRTLGLTGTVDRLRATLAQATSALLPAAVAHHGASRHQAAAGTGAPAPATSSAARPAASSGPSPAPGPQNLGVSIHNLLTFLLGR